MAVKLGYQNVYRDPQGLPEWQRLALPVEAVPEGFGEVAAPADASVSLHGWAMLWTLLGVFAGGMALNLTPCVYPLIPVTVSYFASRDAAVNHRRLVLQALVYMSGLVAANTTLGVAAALTGGLMGALLQNPIVLIAVAAILVLFAAGLFGLWELRLPLMLTRAASRPHTGYVGTLFMGLTMGVVAAPCIGPFVLGLLTWVAGTGSPWIGFIVFFTLSVGLGLPLFVLAVFSSQLQALPRSGEWMVWVKKAMGWVLISMAGTYLRPVLPELWGTFLLAAIALAAGVHLAVLDRTQASFRAFSWLKASVGVVGFAIAMFLIGSWALHGERVNWQTYSEQILIEAQRLKKPVVIDFYASWCSPCRMFEENVFRDLEVVEQAAEDFVMIKIDLTRSGNPVHERLVQHYGVKGVPTVVFLDRTGRERRDLRLVSYVPPDHFIRRMQRMLEGEQKPDEP